VEERVDIVTGRLVAGVVPPVLDALTRRRHHPRDQHELPDRQPLTHHRPGETTQRMRRHHDLVTRGYGVQHGLDVLR
jgi:hypothetical protein